MVMTMLWSIWYNRNHCLHDNHCTIPRILVSKTSKRVLDFVAVSVVFGVANETSLIASSSDQTLSPPDTGVIKLNVDTSFHAQTHESGLQIVARDCDGIILFSVATRLDSKQSSLHVEVSAIL
ncbi:hypothetical protein REPUB_Repub04eG0164300 [Reevesia pubescens]